MKEPKNLGNGLAQIYRISTTLDGSVRLVLDLLPDDKELIRNLLTKKLSGKDLVAVAFVDPGDGNV